MIPAPIFKLTAAAALGPRPFQAQHRPCCKCAPYTQADTATDPAHLAFTCLHAATGNSPIDSDDIAECQEGDENSTPKERKTRSPATTQLQAQPGIFGYQPFLPGHSQASVGTSHSPDTGTSQESLGTRHSPPWAQPGVPGYQGKAWYT